MPDKQIKLNREWRGTPAGTVTTLRLGTMMRLVDMGVAVWATEPTLKKQSVTQPNAETVMEKPKRSRRKSTK